MHIALECHWIPDALTTTRGPCLYGAGVRALFFESDDDDDDVLFIHFYNNNSPHCLAAAVFFSFRKSLVAITTQKVTQAKRQQREMLSVYETKIPKEEKKREKNDSNEI